MPYVTVSEAWIEANVTSRWQAKRGDRLYHAGIDVNRDGIINILDVAWFSERVGQTIYVPTIDQKLIARFYRAPWVSDEEIVNSIRQKFEEFKSQPPTVEELEEWRGIGDVNRDGLINQVDLDIINAAFGSKLGDANWNADADVNNDGIVNILDLSICSKNQNRDLNMERQSIIVDYPLEFRGGPWFCTELEISIYGSPIAIATLILLLIIGILMVTLGVVWLHFEIQLNKISKLADEALVELDDLADMVTTDPTIPQETKDKLLDQIATIQDKIREAKEAADKAGFSGDWMDWFWELIEWTPIIIGGLIVSGVALAALSLIRPPR